MEHETEAVDRLRQLLALKRHEQPPPGYFERLPRDVIAHLRASVSPQPHDERLVDDAGWVGRLVNFLHAKPIFAGMGSAAFCGLILGAILYAERVPPSAADEPLASGLGGVAAHPPLLAIGDSNAVAPLNPQLPPGIFDGGLLNNRSQPADYRPPGP